MFMFVGKQKFVLSIFMNAWRIYCFLCPKIDKKLKAFFPDKENDSDSSNKDTFETLQIRKSKWTPPEGKFVFRFFSLKKCPQDIYKLKFNRNTKFSTFLRKSGRH